MSNLFIKKRTAELRFQCSIITTTKSVFLLLISQLTAFKMRLLKPARRYQLSFLHSKKYVLSAAISRGRSAQKTSNTTIWCPNDLQGILSFVDFSKVSLTIDMSNTFSLPYFWGKGIEPMFNVFAVTAIRHSTHYQQLLDKRV